MASLSGLMRRNLLGIAADEATFARRGFPAMTSAARGHLEYVGHAFVDGYHIALEAGDSIVLQQRLGLGSQTMPRRTAFRLATSMKPISTVWRRSS